MAAILLLRVSIVGFILVRPKIVRCRFLRLLEVGYYVGTSCVDVLLLVAKLGGFNVLSDVGFQ